MVTDAPKRRWYQFSLLTLLVVVTLFCMTVGWIGYRVRENRDRVAAVEKAVALIKESGGEVKFEYEEPTSHTWSELKAVPDDPPRAMKVTEVRLGWRTNATNIVLKHLKNMKGLRRLDLANTNVTDAGLQHLKGLTNLQTLELGGTKVTNAGLEHLMGLTKLQHLHLTSTNVTDAGLEHVKGLTDLQTLLLNRTTVTDAGLKHLQGLTNLQILYLQETKVTNEGVKKLQQALPNCTITHPPSFLLSK